MESGDHLGNLFDDMVEEDNDEDSFEEPACEDSFDSQEASSKANEPQNDSFDEPIQSSVSKQSDDANGEDEINEEVIQEQKELDLNEEDFNLLTIEEVPLDVLTARIRRVFTEVTYRAEPAAIALFDVAHKIIFKSTMLDCKRNTVIDSIIEGLISIIVDERERDQGAEEAEHVLMIFIAKLAIKNKSMKCSDLLYKLILLVDRLYLHADSFVRCRIYRLIACLMEEANRYADVMREHGDDAFLSDEDPTESEVMIPSGVKNRWMGKLAKSLLDKSPEVRCKAVIALSLWDHDIECKTTCCDEVTVNDLLWKSVHDVDESVRVNAARRVHIANENDIDKCIDYVETSKDNRVKQAIIVRLASDVSLLSFSEKQRFRLVNLLNNSDSARVQDVIHQLLVESWMKVAGDEIISPSIFPFPDSDNNNIPKEFPSIILEYLDPLVDPTAVYVFMKFATVRFIQKSTVQQACGSLDVEKFMKDLLSMTIPDCERVGLMRRTTFRLIPKDNNDGNEDIRKIFSRIFISRCFVDVIFNFAKGRLDATHLRSRALTFFLPDVTTFVEHLEKFCDAYFHRNMSTDYTCKDLVLYNLLHLMNVATKYGDLHDDKMLYKHALKKILGNSSFVFSNDVKQLCDWMCDTAKQLMLSHEEVLNLEEAMKNDKVLEQMYLRSATMLLATCKHEEVESPTASMSSLFKTIIPALLGNKNEELQQLGLELIGFATSIDFENCEPYLKLTTLLIQRGDEVLTSTGVNTLIKVIKSQGFPKTANAIFQGEEQTEDDCQDALAKVFEKALVSLQGMALVQSVQDCLSMLSYGRYAWSKLMCAIIMLVFQKSNECLPLVKIFASYCKKSIRSDFNKMNLLLGFCRAVGIISKTGEDDSNIKLLEMTELVCECISSVHTIDGDEVIPQKKRKTDNEEELYPEIVLANRMVGRANSHPSSWIIRHVFTAMATSLRLECVPMKIVDTLHELLVDTYTVVRFNSNKTTQIAFKRFLTHCEKVITLHERMNALKLGVDFKKVKKEVICADEDPKSVSSSSSLGRKRGRKRENSEEEEKIDADDSFELFQYVPKSTRTRIRPTVNVEEDQNIKTEIEDSDDLEDSFEL
nr:RecName: Full=Uncharacterized protein C30G12.6 [Caenorhabditis elegans]|eukprot:NP_495521.1 Uncharacterized protein CELE_C30G12.6 [Caenorhabditis elegans]